MHTAISKAREQVTLDLVMQKDAMNKLSTVLAEETEVAAAYDIVRRPSGELVACVKVFLHSSSHLPLFHAPLAPPLPPLDTHREPVCHYAQKQIMDAV